MSRLYFFHGLESSPQGIKAKLLKQHYPDSIIPELPPDLKKRDQIIDGLITEPAWIVGSSLGGLSALFFAMEKPELVKAMILLAPAVGFYNTSFFNEQEMQRIASVYVPSGVPCTIIAGEYDNVIPMKEIEKMIAKSQDKKAIKLIKLKDEHGLNKFPEVLLDCVSQMVYL